MGDSSVEGAPAVPGYRVLGVVQPEWSRLLLRAMREDSDEVRALKCMEFVDDVCGVEDARRCAVLERETEVLQSIESPFLVACHGVVRAVHRGLPLLAIEFDFYEDTLAGLLERTKRSGRQLVEAEVIQYLLDLCFALTTLHSFQLVHKNVRPTSVFLSLSNEVRLGNYLFAGVPDVPIGSVFSLLAYYPPECLTDSPAFSPSTDIWSLGVVAYELCKLKSPFPSLEDLFNYSNKRTILNVAPHYSDKMNHFVSSCLQIGVYKRPAAAQLLSHKLFLGDKSGEESLS